MKQSVVETKRRMGTKLVMETKLGVKTELRMETKLAVETTLGVEMKLRMETELRMWRNATFFICLHWHMGKKQICGQFQERSSGKFQNKELEKL